MAGYRENLVQGSVAGGPTLLRAAEYAKSRVCQCYSVIICVAVC